jgi:uncharacterized protein (TIGR00156 family)
MVALVVSFLYVRPDAAQTATPVVVPIQSVLAHGKDDQRVVVRGQILQKLDDEKYLIGDGTGHIRVEIDDDLVKGDALAIGAQIEVAGEVDENVFSATSINAERVALLMPRALPAPAPGALAY